MKALEKDRTRRYGTANGFASDIQRHRNGDAVEACPRSARYKLGKFAGKPHAVLATIGSFAVLADHGDGDQSVADVPGASCRAAHTPAIESHLSALEGATGLFSRTSRSSSSRPQHSPEFLPHLADPHHNDCLHLPSSSRWEHLHFPKRRTTRRPATTRRPVKPRPAATQGTASVQVRGGDWAFVKSTSPRPLSCSLDSSTRRRYHGFDGGWAHARRRLSCRSTRPVVCAILDPACELYGREIGIKSTVCDKYKARKCTNTVLVIC